MSSRACRTPGRSTWRALDGSRLKGVPVTDAVRIAHVHDWAPGVRWVDVEMLVPRLDDREADEAAGELLQSINPHCDGALDRGMVRDLLDIADKRSGQGHVGAVRSVSLFEVESHRLVRDDDGGGEGGGGGEPRFPPPRGPGGAGVLLPR